MNNEAYLDLPDAAGSMSASAPRCGIHLMLGLTLNPVELPLPDTRHYEWLREHRVIDRAEAVRLFCQRLLAKAASLSSHLQLLKFTRSIEHIAAGRHQGGLLADQAVIGAAMLALSNARRLMASIAAAECGPRAYGRPDPRNAERDFEITALRSRIADLEAAGQGDAA